MNIPAEALNHPHIHCDACVKPESLGECGEEEGNEARINCPQYLRLQYDAKAFVNATTSEVLNTKPAKEEPFNVIAATFDIYFVDA